MFSFGEIVKCVYPRICFDFGIAMSEFLLLLFSCAGEKESQK